MSGGADHRGQQNDYKMWGDSNPTHSSKKPREPEVGRAFEPSTTAASCSGSSETQSRELDRDVNYADDSSEVRFFSLIVSEFDCTVYAHGALPFFFPFIFGF